jgi:hypothetical protein
VIPSPWVAVVLALAAFRLTRLLGWDDLPPIARARARALGETVNAYRGRAGEPDNYVYNYKRPTLAHLVHCAFCLGFWVACAVYVAWLLVPTPTLYVCVALALSAAVGLVAKNLDP